MTATFVSYEPRIPNNAPLTYLRVDDNFKNVSMQMPIGGVIDYHMPSDQIPPTFVECDGAELDGTVYTELFGVLGTTYNSGDEGANGFRVPDTRGYFIRHLGGVDPDSGRTINAAQSDSFRSHSHQSLGSEFGTTLAGSTVGYLTDDDGSSSGKSTDTSGGDETRPINMPVIRIMKASTLAGGS